MKYKIGIHGCDDSSVFEMELTDEEAEVIKRVAEECTNTSTYGCMPTMTIEARDGQQRDKVKEQK